jgi:hypothetical protein
MGRSPHGIVMKYIVLHIAKLTLISAIGDVHLS